MKKIGKVAAVLVAAGMLFTGVGTAYADDATATGTATPQTTETAPANGSDGTKAATNAAPQSDADAKANAKTEAKPEAAPKAGTKANAAAPQAKAEEVAPQSAGATITNIEKPAGTLKYGAGYNDASKPVFKVTLSGLTVGHGYGLYTNVDYDPGKKPAVGDSQGVYGGGFTANAATQTVEVKYSGSTIAKDIWFALVESDGPASGDVVVGKVVSISDVQVDSVDVRKSITFSDQKVEDVGTHSAGLKAHYTIDEKLLPDVDKICYSTSLLRVFSVQGKAAADEWQYVGWLGAPLWDCVTGAVSDDGPIAASQYSKVRNLADGYAKDQQMIGQWFHRGYTVTGSDLKTSDDISSVLVGLQPDTKYGNWGNKYGNPEASLSALAHEDNPKADPLSMLYSGLYVTFKDGSTYSTGLSENGVSLVSDFTTQKLPEDKQPVASDKLTDINKNGVIGDAKTEAGSTYRLYVDSLKETAACKAAVAAKQYCYWTGYIYSDPVQLGSADGKASAVRVDKDGKAYVEYTIPAGYSGDHKIAVYDDSGNLLGWAPVVVGQASPKPDTNTNNGGAANNGANTGTNTNNGATLSTSANKANTANKNNKKAAKGKTMPKTGSDVLVIAFAGIALLIAGMSVVVYCRRQA